MISQILNDMPMGGSFESEWVELSLEPISNFGKKGTAESMQISWKNVIGALNGVIEILASNDMLNYTSGASISVNSASNQSDSILIVFLSVFRFIKIKFTHNGISGGKLSAVLNYSEIQQ